MRRLLKNSRSGVEMEKKADPKAQLGKKSEKLAEKFLRRKGHRLRARNYSCKHGEIDLITQHKETIVFVEVRSQSSAKMGMPWDNLSRDKKEKVKRTAKNYLYKYRLSKRPFRFDFVQMIFDGENPPEIEHIEDAF
jgi:putative endonuclease